MSRREKNTPGPNAQDDNYEAAVLDFLNREIEAAQPVRDQDEQSSELDALVSDLLKQVLDESDSQQDNNTAAAEDGDSSQSAMPSGLEEVLPPESNLLENLERELSQTVDERDLWDSEVDSGPEISEAAEPRQSRPPSPEPPAPAASARAAEQPESGFVTHVEETVRTQLFAPYPDEVFKPVRPQKKKLSLMAAAAAVLLAIVGGALYYFRSPEDTASKSTLPSPAAPVAVASVPGDQVAPTSVQPDKKSEKPSRVVIPPSKTSAAAGTPKMSAKNAAQRESAATNNHRVPPQPVLQASDNDGVNGDIAGPKAAVKEDTASPVVEQGETIGGTAIVTSDAPVVAVLPAPVPSMEKTPPPAAPPDTGRENAPAERASAQPVTAPAVKSENTVTSTPSTASAPMKARSLVPAVAISQASPSYPELALRTRSSASIVLELQIDEKGTVIKATPVSGPAMFHDSAVNAALKWRYKPASIDGVNVPSHAKVTINFNLKR